MRCYTDIYAKFGTAEQFIEASWELEVV